MLAFVFWMEKKKSGFVWGRLEFMDSIANYRPNPAIMAVAAISLLAVSDPVSAGDVGGGYVTNSLLNELPSVERR